MKHTRRPDNRKGFFSIFRNSLQLKILIPFVILIVLTGGVISAVSYQSSVTMTTDELSQSVESQMLGINETFEIYFDNMESVLNRFADHELLEESLQNEKDVLQTFKETQETTPAIAYLYTGLGTGEMISYPDDDLGSDYVVEENDWYQDAVTMEGQINWSDPYADAGTNEIVVTASKAYYDHDTLIGVVAADVRVSTLIDIVNDIEIGETGFASILNESGKLVAHPDESLINTDQSDEAYYQEIEQAEASSNVEYVADGQEKIMGFAKNPTTNWTIGGVVNKEEFAKKAQSVITPILITLGIVVLLAIIVSLLTARRITKPIQSVMDRMQQIANGDLSHPPLDAKSADEVGQLVQATNDMNDNMRDVLQEINRVSEIVSSQSEELTQSAGEVKAGSEQISSTMQELAAGSETQANRASDLSSSMQQFVQEINEVNGRSEDIQSSSNHVIGMAEEGSALMNQSREQMETIDHIVQDAVRDVEGLSAQTEEISKLVEVIQDVANQTNLLALNAAIEAARAGEHGKGFAVVADEVRKLSEQVAESVTDITEIVTNIQGESQTVTNSLQKGYKEVESGTNQIETTGEKFNGIHGALSEMANNIHVTVRNLTNITSSSDQMNAFIEDIAAVSEESAAGVEETSASSEQTNAAMEEVTDSSKHLAELAEQLNELVTRFKL